MSSTNKTTHYDLPQWIGTDKPTFLGDLNGAFATIDTQLYTAVTNAENANDNASSAAGAVSDMQNDVNGLKTWQTTASSAISGLQNSVNNLTPSIATSASMVTAIGTFLTGFSPSISTNNLMERLITIGNAKFLNIYGNLSVQYTGQPSIDNVANTLNGLTLVNLYSKYGITTSRTFYDLGNLMFNTDSTSLIIPLNLFNNGTNNMLAVPVTPSGSTTLKNNDYVYMDFQALLVLN